MLKVGVIGVGHLGKHHARIYSELDDVQLVGVADVLADRAESIASQYGARAFVDYADMLAQVDAVSIAVPTQMHASIGIDCLERGLDVLVEKPIAEDGGQARAMTRIAGEKGCILQVGHVERFNPVVEAACLVATRPQFFEVHRLNKFSMRSLDVDVVLDLMIHDIDIVLALVESPVSEIRAVGIPVLSDKADIANVRLEFEDGCVANMTASRVSTDSVRKLRFFQPHDYVSLDYASQRGSVLSLDGGRIREKKLEPEVAEPLKLQLEAFVSSVRDRRPPRVSGDDGVKALDVAMSVLDKIQAHWSRTEAIART
jgi:predicted dehydrogenase